MGRLVPLADLEIERQEWGRAMARAAERWVEACARREPPEVLDAIDAEQRHAGRNYKRLTRRIERRKEER